MYGLYGVRKEEFSGAFDAGRSASCRKTSHEPRRTSGGRFAAIAEYFSDFKVQRADGAIRIIRAWRKSPETRTQAPRAWLASTGMSRTD